MRYAVRWTPSFLSIVCTCVIYVFLRSSPMHDVVNSNGGKHIYVRNDVLVFSGMKIMLNYLDPMVQTYYKWIGGFYIPRNKFHSLI